MCLFKQITYTRSTYTDKHFYKIRTRQRKKRHLCFTSNCFGQQCLTSSRRSHKQRAFGQFRSNICIFLWIMQKINYFLQGFFGLILPCNILKGNTSRLLHIDLGCGLTHPHDSSAAHLAKDQKIQQNPYQHQWQYITEQVP